MSTETADPALQRLIVVDLYGLENALNFLKEVCHGGFFSLIVGVYLGYFSGYFLGYVSWHY